MFSNVNQFLESVRRCRTTSVCSSTGASRVSERPDVHTFSNFFDLAQNGCGEARSGGIQRLSAIHARVRYRGCSRGRDVNFLMPPKDRALAKTIHRSPSSPG